MIAIGSFVWNLEILEFTMSCDVNRVKINPMEVKYAEISGENNNPPLKKVGQLPARNCCFFPFEPQVKEN